MTDTFLPYPFLRVRLTVSHYAAIAIAKNNNSQLILQIVDVTYLDKTIIIIIWVFQNIVLQLE